eukprot:CAMPEP_0177391904 /NCGR_PEP_ID=MMETSP0368-20130122/54060_1 /TAXON_ID=447022 ORGANISM="Scrippsiella hangoei-like, Strain SHHI-4" /NCGR_SAMPLE_ID=MMETSP0368 /ASSEMBLY_ACC=CAM_ASM_000363 /LENGTH=34 /DNA_ID= /DNA_START= /DNA_END= /DNA_ORIENTATION=
MKLWAMRLTAVAGQPEDGGASRADAEIDFKLWLF